MTRAPDQNQTDEAPVVWLVDGFNVLHAGLLAGRERGTWWSAAQRDRLLECVAGFDDDAAEIVVVFDGRRPLEPATDLAVSAPRVRVVFADCADDWVVAQVRAAQEPGRLAVVTRDRRLAGRSRHRGARVVSPHSFLARCQPAT